MYRRGREPPFLIGRITQPQRGGRFVVSHGGLRTPPMLCRPKGLIITLHSTLYTLKTPSFRGGLGRDSLSGLLHQHVVILAKVELKRIP